MSTATIRDIFETPDQQRVRADLADFFGPHAEAYLPVYGKMRERSKEWVASWCWPGFFAPGVWLFYRKLYLLGALCLFVPIIVALVFDAEAGTAIAIAVAVALSAKAWYVSAALRRIAEADRLDLQGAERRAFLRRIGGVSPTAGWIVGLLHIAIALLALAALFADAPTLF